MDITTLFETSEIRTNSNGQERLYVEVKPSVLYPGIVIRIREVLGGSGGVVEELLYPAGSLRGDRYALVANWERRAKQVSQETWDDALTPRDQLPKLPNYVGLDNLIKVGARATLGNDAAATAEMDGFGYTKSEQKVILRMAKRAYALELALGWFQEAVRVIAPRHFAEIKIERDLDYKLL